MALKLTPELILGMGALGLGGALIISSKKTGIPISSGGGA
ncbi:unnamed protein product [marine sediment metagenome]|uniref:Uncharacterized protein n=1 Tax=marine sediment metagenome TaxID=412755 RepID=X1T3W7_9ZZZZ